MSILLILIPISLLLATLGLVFFYLTIKSDQYEDLEGDGSRILSSPYDDKPKIDD